MVSKSDTAADLVEEARQRLSVAEADVEDAESQLEEARERAEKYRNFLNVLEEFTGNGDARVSQHDIDSVSGRSGDGLDLSGPGVTVAEGAEAVLREAGKPLKNRQMAERMFAAGFEYEGDVKKLRNTVGTLLNRDAGEDGTFEKMAPGLFGLREWEYGG